jgi:uncharacterized protein involved in outer membrane biogenesis
MRKWFVRSVVFGVVGLCAAAVVLYYRWTNPAAVRQEVIVELQKHFPGALINLDSARLRLLGGIQVQELRLTRKDDNEKLEFLHIPRGVIYHDKEKLLEGQLSIRKLELYRPRLRVHRLADGTWNLDGITGPLRPHIPIPTIVIHQGTILLEDRSKAGNIVQFEINDVHLVVINDPTPTVIIEGGADSPLAGKVLVQGTWDRIGGDFDLFAKTVNLRLSPDVLKRLGTLIPAKATERLELDGSADVELRLAVRPQLPVPVSYRLKCDIAKARVQHPSLPLPIDDLATTLRYDQGELVIDQLSARSGDATVTASGRVPYPTTGDTLEAEFELRNISWTPNVAALLKPEWRDIVDLFEPEGKATIKGLLSRRQGQWSMTSDGREPHIAIHPQEGSAKFKKFAYPVSKITGLVDLRFVSERVNVDVEGLASGRPITVKGAWIIQKPYPDARFEIQCLGVPIDEELLRALPGQAQKIARSFRPAGRVDFHVDARHALDADDFRSVFRIRFRDATVRWDEFPIPFEEVSGRLDIMPERWEFTEFQGRYGAGIVRVQGRAIPIEGTDDQRLHVEIAGQNLTMDPALRQALEKRGALHRAWETFRPSGRLHFSASIDQASTALPDMDVRVEVQGPRIEPTFFPFAMSEVSGKFRYRGLRVELEQVRAKHEGSLLRIDRGGIDLHAGGGFYADLPEIEVRDLKADEQLMEALPPAVQGFARSLGSDDAFDLKTKLVVAQASDPGSQPDLYWDGQLWCRNATLRPGLELNDVTGGVACIGRYTHGKLQSLEGNVKLQTASLFKQPFKDVHAHFRIPEDTPEILSMGLRAPLYGGDVAGEIRFDLRSTLRYEINLTASQVDLEKLGKHNFGPDSKYNGTAAGRLHLVGTSAGTETLDGNGSLDVPNCKLYNLPLLLDLIKFLGLRWPDRTAFEELHAKFAIQGRQVRLSRLELYGNAVSLTGQGDFNLDGSKLNVDFYPSWARIEQLLPPSLRNVSPAVSKNFLVIEMRGKVGGDAKELIFRRKIVPGLMDPLIAIRDRISPPPEAQTQEYAPMPVTAPPVIPSVRRREP